MKPKSVSFLASPIRRPPPGRSRTVPWVAELVHLSGLPVSWSRPVVLAIVASSGLFTWVVLLPLGRVGAGVVAILLLLFALSDALLLQLLVWRAISFGPRKAQWLTMLSPRWLVVVMLLPIAGLVGEPGFTSFLAVFVWLQLLGTAGYWYGMLFEAAKLGCSQLKVGTKHWNEPSPLRLLHLTDLHVELYGRREAALVARARELAPDLILMTGDYTNASFLEIARTRDSLSRLLRQLEAPLGIYATMGTAEIDRRDGLLDFFTAVGVRMLRDEIADIVLEDGRELAILGMDCDHRAETDEPIFESLAALMPPEAFKILLFHSPEIMPLVREHDIDLYLCGHTHGGQLRLPGVGALTAGCRTGKRYEMGLYQEKGTNLYVSRGIGLEGEGIPRMRLFCPPEMALVEIVSESRESEVGAL